MSGQWLALRPPRCSMGTRTFGPDVLQGDQASLFFLASRVKQLLRLTLLIWQAAAESSCRSHDSQVILYCKQPSANVPLYVWDDKPHGGWRKKGLQEGAEHLECRRRMPSPSWRSRSDGQPCEACWTTVRTDESE